MEAVRYLMPSLALLALVNNVLILLVLLPPVVHCHCKLGVKLRGPPSLQRYYVLLAVSNIVCLAPCFYYVLGMPFY